MAGLLNTTPNKDATSSTWGVVTFLDVLGWKGIYNRMDNPIKTLRTLVSNLRKLAEEKRGKVSTKPTIVSISDTIVIYSFCKPGESTSNINVHGELALLAIDQSIGLQIPVRGVISQGDFSCEESVFVGQAVDEAAAWYEHSDWIGVHLSPTADFTFEDSKSNGLWVKYRPPNKTPLAWEPHCVNWARDWQNAPEKIQEIKNNFKGLSPIFPDFASKLINTLKFIEFARSRANRQRKT